MNPEEALARLSDGERACLRLLAAGHDIKSLSADLGISVAAATERLRAARAKLGVTSSREAARLFARGEASAQKSWPIFPEDDHRGDPGHAGPARRGWPAGKGVIVMLVILGLTIGAAALVTTSGQPAVAAPRVVATYPAAGAVIAPGPFTLRVTYDQPMAAGRWSFVDTGRAAFPACTGAPQQSADRRSFTLRCTAAPATAFAVGFNTGRFRNFRSAAGQTAEPFLLRFAAK